jgi:hypothetical protein
MASSMFLDYKSIPQLSHLLSQATSDNLRSLAGASSSLSASLYLGLAARESVARNPKSDLANKITALNLPFVNATFELLGASSPQVSQEPFGAPSFEIFRIGSKHDLLTKEWSLFRDRFRRSATAQRRSDMFYGVAGVFGEMGDNVVWHGSKPEGPACIAVAGYHVADDVSAFSVIDGGQGFLASLKRTSTWQHLTSERQALDAVVTKQATSREGEVTGGGFKQLFNSLLDFNGLVLLRSGNCTYHLENQHDIRKCLVRESFPVNGAQVTVIVSPAEKSCEKCLDSFC